LHWTEEHELVMVAVSDQSGKYCGKGPFEELEVLELLIVYEGCSRP
jgi:hypothetical protein